jgi:hypothetical protein
MKKTSGFEASELRRVFLSENFVRSVKRFHRGDVRVDWNYKRFVGSLFSPLEVFAAFDLGPKGSLIPFFVERQKGLELQLPKS